MNWVVHQIKDLSTRVMGYLLSNPILISINFLLPFVWVIFESECD